MSNGDMVKLTLTTKEAAEKIGVCKSTLDKSRVTGSLKGLQPPPYIRIDLAVRYKTSDILEWVSPIQTFTTLAQENQRKECCLEKPR